MIRDYINHVEILKKMTLKINTYVSCYYIYFIFLKIGLLIRLLKKYKKIDIRNSDR